MSGTALFVFSGAALFLAVMYWRGGGKIAIPTTTMSTAAKWADAYKTSYGEGELLAWERHADTVREAAAADVKAKTTATVAPKSPAQPPSQ